MSVDLAVQGMSSDLTIHGPKAGAFFHASVKSIRQCTERSLVAEKEDMNTDEGMSIYRILWDAEKQLRHVPSNNDQTQQQAVRAIMPELKFLE